MIGEEKYVYIYIYIYNTIFITTFIIITSKHFINMLISPCLRACSLKHVNYIAILIQIICKIKKFTRSNKYICFITIILGYLVNMV